MTKAKSVPDKAPSSPHCYCTVAVLVGKWTTVRRYDQRERCRGWSLPPSLLNIGTQVMLRFLLGSCHLTECNAIVGLEAKIPPLYLWSVQFRFSVIKLYFAKCKFLLIMPEIFSWKIEIWYIGFWDKITDTHQNF